MNTLTKLGLSSLVLAAALGSAATPAWAMEPSDGGVFVALDEAGEPVRKILRVTHTETGWKFEDQLEDGSWLDVSCHGGCDHVASGSQDLLRFFGALPPDDIRPDCIHNEEYAFCRLERQGPGPGQEGFVLVVRAGQRWQPISMARLAGPETDPSDTAPEIESNEAASLGSSALLPGA